MYGNKEDKIRKIRKNATKLQNNPNWKGGKSYEPYPLTFNKEFKNSIKRRDNYTCMGCGENNKTLCVHHIDYNKKNTTKENCISLCRVCHTKTNYNRNKWEQKYTKMLLKEKNYA